MKVYGDVASVNLRTGKLTPVSRGFTDVKRLGPKRNVVLDPLEADPTIDQVIEYANNLLGKKAIMHYRNGREAKNGDKIVQLDSEGKVTSFGVLHSAVPGNDYCNGYIATIQSPQQYACMCDCLHVDDVAAILTEKELHKRPPGK